MKTLVERAYKRTNLEASYSKGKIEKMLNELGITDIRFTQSGNDHQVEFMVRMQFNEFPRKVRINIPVDEMIKKNKEQTSNFLFRVLYHHLKEKFVAIKSGLKEFEEEFLADIVIMHEGKEMRLGDVLTPRIKNQLKNSPITVLSLN